MHRLKTAFAMSTVMVMLAAAAANARPTISLKLQGLVVTKDAKGADKYTPLEQAPPTPGETIRYVIVASNAGTDEAKHFSSVGRIPAGTSYVPGSASTSAARVEFSLDGGKTWAANPTVVVRTAAGSVAKSADPQTYTAVRWAASAPLPPKSSQTFVYAVRVR